MRASMIASGFLPLLLLTAGTLDAGSRDGARPASPPVLLLNAWDCNTLADLGAWREHRNAEIAKFVPKDFQNAAIRGMQNDFDERTAQLHTASDTQAATAGEASVVIAEDPPRKALPVFLPSEGRYSTEGDLSEWRVRQDQQILALVPDDYLKIARESLGREYDTRASALQASSEDSRSVGGNLPALLFLPSAKNVSLLADLQVWRSVQASRVQASVPEAYRAYALRSVGQEYEKHLERLTAGKVGFAPPPVAPVPPVAPPPAAATALNEQKPAGGAAWAVLGAAVFAISAAVVAAGRRRRRGDGDEEEGSRYIMVA